MALISVQIWTPLCICRQGFPSTCISCEPGECFHPEPSKLFCVSLRYLSFPLPTWWEEQTSSHLAQTSLCHCCPCRQQGKFCLAKSLSMCGWVMGPRAAPSTAPLPKSSLPDLSPSTRSSASQEQETVFNCGNVTSYPKLCYPNVILFYVNADGTLQTLPKEMGNYNYFDYQLDLSWSCFVVWVFFSVRDSQSPLKTLMNKTSDSILPTDNSSNSILLVYRQHNGYTERQKIPQAEAYASIYSKNKANQVFPAINKNMFLLSLCTSLSDKTK